MIFWYVDEPVVFVERDVPAYLHRSAGWIPESPSFRCLAVACEDTADALPGPFLPHGVWYVDVGN